jgi:hypothetical protein
MEQGFSDISAISVEIGRAKATFFSPKGVATGKKLVSILDSTEA